MSTRAAGILGIIALAVFTISAPGAGSGDLVYGAVLDTGGAPLPWAQLDLQTLQRSTLATGWTSRDGRFSIFTPLSADATYLIKVSGADLNSYTGAATLRTAGSMPFVARLSSVASPIEITSVSPFGSQPGYVQGVARGVTGSTHAVMVCIYVPGAGWWSKPTFDLPCTTIKADGTWKCLTTTGGADASATIFKAFVIPIDQCENEELLAGGYECTPEALHAVAVDTDTRLRPDPRQRRVQFSGREWLVKSSSELSNSSTYSTTLSRWQARPC